MPIQKLSRAAQTLIVQRLAAFDTPSQIVLLVKEEYGVEITRQSVANYHPEHNPLIKREWRDLFDAQRQQFLERFDAEPLNSLNYRQALRRRALDEVKSPRLRLDIVNEASQDFYQHAEMMRKAGEAHRPRPAPLEQLSRQERLARLEALLEKRGLTLVPKA